MKTKTSKRQSQIPQLVERGFAIHQQLTLLNDEFKKIKERLKDEAAGRPAERLPLLDKNSEGTQWIALGNGCECRIVFPDAKIKTDFDPGESDFLTIRTLAGNHFKALFRKVTRFQPIERKTFRNQVNNLLKPKRAIELLELCSSPSESKAVWKARPVMKSRRKKSATR
jgi:hypothetical protein